MSKRLLYGALVVLGILFWAQVVWTVSMLVGVYRGKIAIP